MDRQTDRPRTNAVAVISRVRSVRLLLLANLHAHDRKRPPRLYGKKPVILYWNAPLWPAWHKQGNFVNQWCVLAALGKYLLQDSARFISR